MYNLQLEMDSKLDRMLDMLNAQFKMLGTILHGIDKLAPKPSSSCPPTAPTRRAAAPISGDSCPHGSNTRATGSISA